MRWLKRWFWGKVLAAGFRWVREENGGRLPLPAYLERIITLPTLFVEVAVIWEDQIFLIKRPDTDALFPGQWHVSGGAVVGRETPDDMTQHQLTEGGIAHSGADVRFGGVIAMPKIREEIAWYVFFLLRLDRKPAEDSHRRLFPLDQLPDGFVRHQREGYMPLIHRLLKGGPPELVVYLEE